LGSRDVTGGPFGNVWGHVHSGFHKMVHVRHQIEKRKKRGAAGGGGVEGAWRLVS